MKYSDETIEAVSIALDAALRGSVVYTDWELACIALNALESTDEQKKLRADAERLPIAIAERDHARAMQERIFDILMSIHNLAAPAPVEVNGTTYRFAPKDSELVLDAWHEMSKRIREIPMAIGKAREA